MVSIQDVRAAVEQNFPGLWFYLEACLSVMATLNINDIREPASIILKGPPSSQKTTTLRLIGDHPRTYWSNSFTPVSFVTCLANRTEEELRQIDLLPRIRYKTLIVPELAPTFNARREILTENISTLTSLFDGDGHTRDCGTHPRRGYSGDYMFCFLAATTPMLSSFWNVLGNLGNRLCFLNTYRTEDSNFVSNFARQLRTMPPYGQRIDTVRQVIHSYLDDHFSDGHFRSVNWNRSQDSQELVEKIVSYAVFSGKLRGYIQYEGSYYNLNSNTPQVESPERFGTYLHNLARGRAFVNERNQINESDLELVKEVALSSCYLGRSTVIRSIIANSGSATTNHITDTLNCSRGRAQRLIDELVRLEVLEESGESLPGGGRRSVYTLEESAMDLFFS